MKRKEDGQHEAIGSRRERGMDEALRWGGGGDGGFPGVGMEERRGVFGDHVGGEGGPLSFCSSPSCSNSSSLPAIQCYNFPIKDDRIAVAITKSSTVMRLSVLRVSVRMELIFEIRNGTSFCIEIGYFDSVLEIKQKVERYQNIPVQRQTLSYNGKELPDDGDIWKCDIYHRSRIHLVVAQDQQPSSPAAVPKKVQLVITLPGPKPRKISVVMELNDTVALLKKRIQETEGIPANRLILLFSGKNELQNKRTLQDYQLTDGSEILIAIRPSPASSGSTAPASTKNSSKKLKVMVWPKDGSRLIPVEVTASDKVQVLRNDLEKLQQKYGFQLPTEGYFFIYKQSVMEEKESFQWHNVSQGDTIEIFNGSVTSGT